MTRRPTSDPNRPPSGAQRTKGATSFALLLYRCPRLSAWLSVNACTALRSSTGPRGPQHRYDRTDLEQPREVRPCSGCPGVLELRARRETPKPRRYPA